MAFKIEYLQYTFFNKLANTRIVTELTSNENTNEYLQTEQAICNPNY